MKARLRMCSSAKSPINAPEMQTLKYYEHNAESYYKATRDADLSELYKSFTRKLSKPARILDAGSGSGRDSLAFLRCGYEVKAFDSSPSLCKLSTRLTGVNTRTLRFQELEDEAEYDGIWACASLLHVPETELRDAVLRLVRALKPGGVLYMSFKHGAGERITADGRFFIDMTDSRLRRVLQTIPDAKVEELWVTAGEGQFQGRGEWLNALVSRQKPGVAYG